MKMSQWFDFKSQRFYLRTLICLLVLIASLCCGGPRHRRDARVPTSREQGGLIVTTASSEWDSLSLRIADHLMILLADQQELELIRPFENRGASEIRMLKPDQTEGVVKQAWDAYYSLQFDTALSLLASVSGKKNNRAILDPHRESLLALIHFVKGSKRKAREILMGLLAIHPEIGLSEQGYPPRFVRFYKSLITAKHPKAPTQVTLSANDLRDLRGYTQEMGWDHLWFLHMQPVGWNARVELQEFRFSGRSLRRRAVVEVEKGADPKKAAKALISHIFRR